jgi:hypothetical protein
VADGSARLPEATLSSKTEKAVFRAAKVLRESREEHPRDRVFSGCFGGLIGIDFVATYRKGMGDHS